MRFSCKSVALAIAISSGTTAFAQGITYKLGRTPTAEEIQAWDQSVGPAGKELPPGKGTATEGAVLFEEKCSACHGANGEGSKMAPRLLSEKGGSKDTEKSLGNYWPFATTIWDFINRAMPRLQGGSLTPNEVYSLTAFLLYRSDIIQEDTVIDAKTLPQIHMPNRNGFIPSPWPIYPRPGPRPFGLYP